MNKLDMSMYDSVKEEYFKKIKIKIESSYQKYKSLGNKKFFDSVKICDFFEDDNGYNEEKVRKIIFMNFVNINNNYDEFLKNYFYTGALINYIDFSIRAELEKNRLHYNNNEKFRYRQNFVEMYRNPWVEQYIIKHPNYYKTNDTFTIFIKDIKKEYEDMNKILKEIINYKNLDSDMRHKIIIKSKITVCPYCDRQYISYFMNNGKVEQTTADLDHFYPKSKFPLFSLSLYNFIPSCQICNQRFKNQKMLKILYPFKDGFDEDAKFIYDYKNVDSLFGEDEFFDLKLKIKADSKKKDFIINNKKMFHLESLYANHKPYIKELLIKSKLIYNEAYLSQITATFTQLGLNEEQLQTFLYGYNFKNPNRNKTLGKLTKDILDILEDD